MAQFTKLGELVDKDFTVQSVGSYKWKLWNNETKKMIVSDDYFEGAKKKWPLSTDKGQLDIGKYQLGDMLSSSLQNGKVDLIGKTFTVKSNGKSGMDVRYFINPARQAQGNTPSQSPVDPPQPLSNGRNPQETSNTPSDEPPIENYDDDLGSVPF